MGWHFSDSGEHWLVELSNGSLHAIAVTQAPDANVSLTLNRATLEGLLQQQIAPLDAVQTGQLKIGGNPLLLAAFFGLLDRFAGNFPVVDAAPWPA